MKKRQWDAVTLTARLPIEYHYKMGIIAAKRYSTQNALLLNLIRTAIEDWEMKHGEIELPEDIKKEEAAE